MEYSATYSPEDNKLRLTASERLDEKMYLKVKDLGFRWAPAQKIFVKPSWSPQAEDFLMALCGSIGDENTTLQERSQVRANRFDVYSDKRAEDAKQASEAVEAITDNIPMGQPILIGHHSQRKAEKDAQKIERGLQKAVNMWETSEYWTRRAEGALADALYKQRPDVRARRIKKLQAEKRKCEKYKKESEKVNEMWANPVKFFKDKENLSLDMGRAKVICNYFDRITVYYTKDKYPESTYEGANSLYSGLEKGLITPEQAKAISRPVHDRTIKNSSRWIEHLSNRIVYETAMLDDQGASDLLKPKARPKQLPLVNYKTDSIDVVLSYGSKPTALKQIEMTKAEYKAIREFNRWIVTVEGSHRMKTYVKRGENYSREQFAVFLTDSKVHKKPEAIEPEPVQPVITEQDNSRQTLITPNYAQSTTNSQLEKCKDMLKQGVKVAVSNQLYPTPQGIAEQMVLYANIEQGMSVLEPSAGTGNIVNEIVKNCGTELTSVEINYDLCTALKTMLSGKVVNKDFLECNGDIGTFDRIVMNPPFEKGSDIKHINHALEMLKPGGRLVAICANGPKQQAAFKDIAEHWEDLPQGTFKNTGTNVNTALIVLTK